MVHLEAGHCCTASLLATQDLSEQAVQQHHPQKTKEDRNGGGIYWLPPISYLHFKVVRIPLQQWESLVPCPATQYLKWNLELLEKPRTASVDFSGGTGRLSWCQVGSRISGARKQLGLIEFKLVNKIITVQQNGRAFTRYEELIFSSSDQHLMVMKQENSLKD